MSVQITILGSGSGGNSLYLETEGTRLLIDAGFSARQVRQRLASIGRAPESLSGILVTHEHSDHTQGLAVLCGKSGVPIYCNRYTQEAIQAQAKAPLQYRLFSTGNSFEIGDVVVDTFTVPHDASDPVGFLIRTPQGNLGLLTDLGHATKLAMERVRQANVLLLETNHDVQMLQNDLRRPWSLKQRILSRHGHLSNEAAADALEQILSDNLQKLYLAHLSRECNRPEIALQTVCKRLAKLGAAHLPVEVTFQDKPNPTFLLGPRTAPSQ